MNQMTSQQRKLVYLAGIVILLIPIIWLGMPSTGESDSGGKLARLRQEHDLGESTLGEVDPSSATMNLVLLGLRGVATNLLWMEANEQQKTKDWAQLRSTVDSIIMLQPHFLKVWQFQGWNLAYNVSAEWDAVEDRYYWVKEGAKFMMRGSERNRHYPELYWETGRILGQKIGRADEWRHFRQFFKSDPDPKFDGGPDPELNPQGKDNYLVAKEWFQRANEVELDHEQHIMMRPLFRSYPTRAQLDYAEALQREGIFDEVTRRAWDQGFEEWTQEFGREIFQAPGCELFLEVQGEEDIQQLAERNDVEEDVIRHWVDRYQKVTNYRYWRTRALAEADPITVAAHRELHEGEELLKQGDVRDAQKMLESGMEKFRQMLSRYPTLASEELTIEEGLMAVLQWQKTHQLMGTPVPQQYPLKPLWESQMDRIPMLEQEFNRRFGGL